eukprot:m51a1_g8947 hypothetical protein (470) ;mRNA; f:993803-995327
MTTARAAIALAVLALHLRSAASYALCGASGGADCQMGWSTQAPEGPATGGEGGAQYTATTRAELITALRVPGKKTVFVSGTIRGDDLGNGKRADEAYYTAQTGFDRDAYTRSPSSMERQRLNLQYLQAPQTIIDVTSDTSIIGLNSDARIVEGSLRLKGVRNVVVRNVAVEAPHDWAAQRAADGGWSALYDAVSVENSTRVWLDHLTLADGPGARADLLDGLVDITRGSDYVTVSRCVLGPHDRASLVGHSDGAAASDAGALRVTFYANLWSATLRRSPLVRYGRVHLLGNRYALGAAPAAGFAYGVGLGYRCSVLSEGNAWEAPAARPGAPLVAALRGTAFKDVGSWVDGAPGSALLAAAAGVRPDYDIGWVPPYRYSRPTGAAQAAAAVLASCGAGGLRSVGAGGDGNATAPVPHVPADFENDECVRADRDDADDVPLAMGAATAAGLAAGAAAAAALLQLLQGAAL